MEVHTGKEGRQTGRFAVRGFDEFPAVIDPTLPGRRERFCHRRRRLRHECRVGRGVALSLMECPAYMGSDWKVEPLCDINHSLDQVAAMVKRLSG